jgi:solute carrier family 25 (adenine nucleotide translocator) protein 4/5/6/31
LSGGLAGAASLLFTTPLHLARTVLASDVLAPELGRTVHQYAGVADVLAKTVRHSGPLGLFNGFGVSVAGVILYRAFYFGLYDSVRCFVPQQHFLGSFLTSMGITIVAGLATYPFDTIRCAVPPLTEEVMMIVCSHDDRRRLMIAGATPMAYDGTFDCVATIWREEGIEGFFRGALANVARSFVSAAVLCLYDALMVAAIPAPPAAAHHNANQGDDDDE